MLAKSEKIRGRLLSEIYGILFDKADYFRADVALLKRFTDLYSTEITKIFRVK